MFLKTRGIILRTVKYSESSLVVDMYTEIKGRQSYIISGIRSKSAKTKAGLLQVMGLVDLIAYDKEHVSLNRIKEIKADYLYRRLPFDALRSSIGLFFMEVCIKTVKETEANPELYHFIKSQMLKLDEPEVMGVSVYPIRFLCELSRYLGFGIQNDYSEVKRYFDLRNGAFAALDFGPQYSLNEGASHSLSNILDNEASIVPKPVRNLILDQLILYYRYHVENFDRVKSLDILRSIFN